VRKHFQELSNKNWYLQMTLTRLLQKKNSRFVLISRWGYAHDIYLHDATK